MTRFCGVTPRKGSLLSALSIKPCTHIQPPIPMEEHWKNSLREIHSTTPGNVDSLSCSGVVCAKRMGR